MTVSQPLFDYWFRSFDSTFLPDWIIIYLNSAISNAFVNNDPSDVCYSSFISEISTLSLLQKKKFVVRKNKILENPNGCFYSYYFNNKYGRKSNNTIIVFNFIFLYEMSLENKMFGEEYHSQNKKKKFQDSTSSCFQSGNNIICLTISNILWYKEKKRNEAKQQQKNIVPLLVWIFFSVFLLDTTHE